MSSRQNAQGQTYAVDYIRQQVIAAVGWDRAINEGYRIHTTIDVDLQKVAEDSLRTNLERTEQRPDYNHQTYTQYAASFRKAKANGTMTNQPAPEYLQGAIIGLDNATGDILVLVGGRDFEHNQYDRALQARRPAGTAMLPFVYAAAFEKGLYPGSLVEDSPLDNRAVMIGGTTGILGVSFAVVTGSLTGWERADQVAQIIAHSGMVHGQIGFERAMHAQHAKKPGIIGREGAQTHQRQRARRAHILDQRGKGVASINARIDQPAAAMGVGVLSRPNRGPGPGCSTLGSGMVGFVGAGISSLP